MFVDTTRDKHEELRVLDDFFSESCITNEIADS